MAGTAESTSGGGAVAIARVRIAPVERWCEGIHDNEVPREAQWDERVVGMLIGIHPDDMSKWDKCEGKVWRVEQSSTNAIRAKLGWDSTQEERFLCEHALELD